MRPPPSELTFPDGANFRIEIPSVEGPRVLASVLNEAEDRMVTVNRVSQGSGAMLLTSSELREMASMGRDAGAEICLFVGPRAGWDVGVLPHISAGYDAMIRGSRQIDQAIRDVSRAVECGIRAFLVGDIGLLRVLATMRDSGNLPSTVVFKVSAYLGVFNAPAAQILADLGADTINIPADLSQQDISELRSAVDRPLDLYVEAPDGMGGTIRIPELAELISVGSPLYAKFGLRNAPGVYPSGLHIEPEATSLGREKVHRAQVALEWLAESGMTLTQSEPRAAGLAVPEP